MKRFGARGRLILVCGFVIGILSLTIFNAWCAAKSPQNPDPGIRVFTLQQLKEDFKQLKITLESQHPMLYTNKEELSRLYQTQAELVDKPMTEPEFFRILSPIVAKLNCGHTSLSLSKALEESSYKKGRYLPFEIKISADRAYLYQNLTPAKIPAGAEILALNGKPMPEIIAVFLNNITADGYNTSKKYYIINHWFPDLYFSLIGDPDQFTITYRDPAGSDDTTVTVAAMPKEQIDQAVKRLAAVRNQNQGTGLYWQRLEPDYAVLTVKSFGFYDPADRNTFRAYLDGFFKTLAERKTPHLILDLRDNWGGDPNCSSYLYQYLIAEPSPYFAAGTAYYYNLTQPLQPLTNRFRGELYILTNGACFSSTGHLCSLLRYHRIGVFIGEETGGSYVCTDGSQDITLRNTKIRLHYATTAFQTAVTGLTPGRGVMPDYAVTLSIDDYLAGKDAAMEFARGFIEGKK